MRYFIFVFIFLLVSCNTAERNKDLSDGNTMDVRFYNKDLKNIIYNYITTNPEIKSFVLITDLGQKVSDCEFNMPKMILLGPAYHRLFDSGEDSYIGYPCLVMKKENILIFIQSSVDIITEENRLKNLYEENNIILPDSVDSYVTFLSRAIAIRVSRNSAELFSEQVDTLLLKKNVPFIVPPIK